MSDLVKRARAFANLEDTDAHGLVEDLADEIERLRNIISAALEQAEVRNWTVVRIYLSDAENGPCEHVSEFIWGDDGHGHWACKKCGERVPSSLPQ